MFKVLNARKRRVISPATIVASVAAHVLLLGGAVYAANDTGPREVVTVFDSILPPLPAEKPEPKVEEPTPPPPAPEQPRVPNAPAPVPGEVLQVREMTQVPEVIKPEPPGTPPVVRTDYERDGVPGDVKGPPAAGPRPPSDNTVRDTQPYVPSVHDVEEQPVLNRDGLSRTMERYYPSILRDSRVAGRVVVELIVDADGRVRPNSAEVVEATHPAFGEATLRAVERFRFRPAKMGGVPVAVRVTIPINWTVPR